MYLLLLNCISVLILIQLTFCSLPSLYAFCCFMMSGKYLEQYKATSSPGRKEKFTLRCFSGHFSVFTWRKIFTRIKGSLALLNCGVYLHVRHKRRTLPSLHPALGYSCERPENIKTKMRWCPVKGHRTAPYEP